MTQINTDGKNITGVEIQDYSFNKISIRAKCFILAAGGIENSRLLLWSNQKNNGKLIDPISPLGKYWMEHPHFHIGNVIKTSFKNTEYFSLSAKSQDALGILGCGLRLEVIHHDEAINMVVNLACVAPKLGKWAFNKLNKNLICGSRLIAVWEEEPIAENCIKLSNSSQDMFGIPLTELHWKKNTQDFKTARLTAEQFGRYLISSGKGRLQINDWLLKGEHFPADDELAGHHHMGGTRMANSSKNGVVDKNLKVFGQNNLFIAGSSVFPTSGYANPTLTIVQLSLRLGEYLGKNF